MTKRNRSPEDNARRAKIRESLKAGNVSSMDDIAEINCLSQVYQQPESEQLPLRECTLPPCTGE